MIQKLLILLFSFSLSPLSKYFSLERVYSRAREVVFICVHTKACRFRVLRNEHDDILSFGDRERMKEEEKFTSD